MTEINIRVRLGKHTIYKTQVYIGLEKTVFALKSMVCRENDNIQENMLVPVYCGEVMDDDHLLRTYNLNQGATVHMFSHIKPEKRESVKPLSENEILKLSLAFRSLSLNSSYRAELMKLINVNDIYKVVLKNPYLSYDPIGISFLQHPELLAKMTDVEMVKRIASAHPALATAALKISASVHEEVMQNQFASDMARSILNHVSDEDLDDLHDSSPASETSNSRPVSRNLSFGTITAAQLASAIASVTPLTSQPSTSGASTSAGNTRNVLEINPERHVNVPILDIPTQLQIMRDMGLENDALNLEALRHTGNLENAIEYVLNSFNVPSPDTNNS